MNLAILTGRVGKTPDIKVFTDNKLAQFSLATGKKWRDKDGNPQERTEWHNIIVNGKLAEIVEKYVLKGSQISITGEIRYREWTDKEDKKHLVTEIHAQSLELLGEKPKEQRAEATEAGQVFVGKEVVVNPGEDDLPF